MDHDSQRTEPPFLKARAYLNYHRSATWLAHLAAAGCAVVTIGLLVVLWLYADLMVWRGRVPSSRELAIKQQNWLEKQWNKLTEADRFQELKRAGLDEKTASALAALEYEKLTHQQKEIAWQEIIFDELSRRVGPQAAERIFPPERVSTPGAMLDGTNHGVLSLVVREISADRIFTPLPWLASWNRWMWNNPDSESVFSTYLTGLMILAIILGLAWVFLVVLNGEMAARAAVEASNRLRRAVYHHTFRLGTLAIRALGPVEAVTILTRHVEAVHDALFVYLTAFYREPITLGALLLFAFLVDPLLSLVFILFVLVVWRGGLRVSTALSSQELRATNVSAERLTIIRESLMLMRLVKAYMMETFNQARIERQLSRYSSEQRDAYRAKILIQPAVIVLAGFSALVLFYVAALSVLFGQTTTAGAVVLAATLLSLYRPLNSWLESRKILKRGRDAAEQVFTFLERKGDVGQVVGAEFLHPLAKKLEFDKVSLRDPGSNKPLLEDVSLTIPAGERIGLVGAENLEKHALVYLIPRLLDPTAGEIRIDQHNLRWVTLESLRTQVGTVMMHNLVFHDTVRNNIGCGDQNHTLPQIIEAAKIAHAHHFIQKLPQGYETPIGELGHPLSLSEQYRLALARAILRDPALLIIEEPDVELDAETKDLLDDTLARLLPGRTAIFIPHRISTLKACNCIHLLSRGRVVASGTHKELLSGNKLYRHLHYLEFNQMDEVV